MQAHASELSYKGFDVEKSEMLGEAIETIVDAKTVQEIYDQI